MTSIGNQNTNVPEEDEDDLMGLYDDNDVENEGNDSTTSTASANPQSKQQLVSVESLIRSKDSNDEEEEKGDEEVGKKKEETDNVEHENKNDVQELNPKTPTRSLSQQQQQTSSNVIVEETQVLPPKPILSTPQSTIQNINVNNTSNLNTISSVSSARSNFTTPKPTPSQTNNEVEALNDEIATLLLTNKINLTTSSKLQTMLRENVSLKEKITKLKTLLARSSKVSKETKLELDKAQREVLRLTQRVESLANRPTHMDLLADFETNFDRALMSLHNDDVDSSQRQQQQSGGEDTMPTIPMSQPQLPSLSSNPSGDNNENVSTLLLTELSQTKSRMEHLETLNSQLVLKATKLGKENEQYVSQLERQNLKMSNLQLELRMAKMETENATREVKAKAASLSE